VDVLRKFTRCEQGGTAIEYALIAGTISMVIVVALLSIGSSLKGFFTSVKEGFST
jgi:pilus assembly protein Flp/PilA